MDRRAFLLTGAAALGVAGCTQAPSPRPSGSATPRNPDDMLRASVGDDELALIAAYRSAIADRPELTQLLASFLAHHESHLIRIDPDRGPSAASPASPTPASATASPTPASATASPTPASATASPATSGSPSVDTAPARSADAVLAELAAAEKRARAARIAACDAAADAALARDLCLVAASEAQHAARLAAEAANSRAR